MRNLALIITFLIMFAFGLNAASAQLTIKIPKIKIDKPEKERDKINDTNTNGNLNTKTSGSKLIYEPQSPTNVPVLVKNSIYVQAQTHNEYWKMPNQSNYSSWVPIIRFDNYYNNDRRLNYTVEYFNPDGSSWYSEKLEQGNPASDRTVMFQSPSPFTGVLDTKSTAATGIYSFKITNQDTKEVVYQGKFKVGKFSRANNPQEKNKFQFYVEHDWLLPFGMIGFHHSGIEIGGMPLLVNVWLKGAVERDELEARLFYKGQQLASTKDDGGGVRDNEDRTPEYAVVFAPQNAWKRWEFQWGNILLDNNGSFNRELYTNVHYVDKNPGDYTVKIYRNGAQIRELNFTVGADRKFVAPAYANQILLPYHRLILPVKFIGTTEKWDAMGWKTDAFYGNPLTGFAVQ